MAGSRTRIVVFSKDRTLQLCSLLGSLFAYSDAAPEDVTVIHTATLPGIDYAPVERRFPGSRFVRQDDFHADLLRAAREGDRPLVAFLVDDLIFRAPFRLREIERFLLEERLDVDGFSLRLGEHIRDGRPPAFERAGEFLVWRTAPGLGRTWNYAWEVSASIYRRERVLEYLGRCSPAEVRFPNPLESVYYRKLPSWLGGWRNLWWAIAARGRRSHTLACCPVSRAFTQGVNLVAEGPRAFREVASPLELHQKLLAGWRIDWESLAEVRNEKPNAGAAHFKLVQE